MYQWISVFRQNLKDLWGVNERDCTWRNWKKTILCFLSLIFLNWKQGACRNSDQSDYPYHQKCYEVEYFLASLSVVSHVDGNLIKLHGYGLVWKFLVRPVGKLHVPVVVKGHWPVSFLTYHSNTHYRTNT